MSAHGDVATGDGWILFCGDYREQLPRYTDRRTRRTDPARVRFEDASDLFRSGDIDAVLTDPPYSVRTHRGHDAGHDAATKINAEGGAVGLKRGLSYAYWTSVEVAEFVEFFDERCESWIGVMSDHVLQREWEAHLQSTGRYVFAPIPCIQRGGGFRMAGDGPSSWSVWLTAARPKEKRFLGGWCSPGAYDYSRDRGGHIGGKPLAMMRAIVRNFSRRGDVVCDPCAGGGTTLLAAVTEGRLAVGCELDPATFGVAVARLRRGHSMTFDFEEAEQ